MQKTSSTQQSCSILEDRTIEFDGLAIVLLVLAFAGVSAFVFWILVSASQESGVLIYLASALVGQATVIAWIFGYPRRAAIPAMSFVLVCAIALLPYVFDLNGALLREATGAPASRLYVAAGLYVGGLGLVVLAFFIFGFLGPLVGALVALRRGDPAAAVLKLHIALGLGAVLVLVVSRLPLWL